MAADLVRRGLIYFRSMRFFIFLLSLNAFIITGNIFMKRSEKDMGVMKFQRVWLVLHIGSLALYIFTWLK